MKNPKIDIYYKDSKKATHYLHSTNSHKLVREAVKAAKELYKKLMYKNPTSKKVGESIVSTRIFGRKA